MQTYSTTTIGGVWFDLDVGIDDIYGWGLLPLHDQTQHAEYWGLSLCLGWFEIGLTVYKLKNRKDKK